MLLVTQRSAKPLHKCVELDQVGFQPGNSNTTLHMFLQERVVSLFRILSKASRLTPKL